MKAHSFVGLLVGVILASACGNAEAPDQTATIDVSANTIAHEPNTDCTGRFEAVDLDHVTSGPGTSRSMFDGTGAGVAVGDLDGNGWDDIVLANLSGESSIMWNRGALDFEREALTEGRFRHVVIVDINGDAANDIVVTTGVGRPLALTNNGQGESAGERFVRDEISGIDSYAYSMSWADLGGDGDLDAVTGSYNSELTANRRLTLGELGGVAVFENTENGFEKQQLTKESQALAVRLGDLNNDGRADIVVGNDLATPDQAWLAADAGWERISPFSETAYSTMSLDSGDVDNDGDLELFATDMKPMTNDAETQAKYIEVQADLDAAPVVDDIQRPENVLLMPSQDGFVNRATSLGVEATGWSWSGVFGDLDNDGFSDLYVVNGMVADNLFAHLPDDELVEPNQAFRNISGEAFEPAPDWGLGDVASGRGMVMADLDRDGDLDIVVNNLNQPSRLFENSLCGGRSLTVSLEWSQTDNQAAIGASVSVIDDRGTRRLRTIEVSRGYLSGAPATAHFGLGDATGAVAVEVLWPDGERSVSSEVEFGNHVIFSRPGSTQ